MAGFHPFDVGKEKTTTIFYKKEVKHELSMSCYSRRNIRIHLLNFYSSAEFSNVPGLYCESPQYDNLINYLIDPQTPFPFSLTAQFPLRFCMSVPFRI